MFSAAMRGALAGAVLMLLAGTTVSAAAELKIGFVNPARVSSDAPQAEAARRNLQQEFEPRDERIVRMQDELRKLEDRLQHDAAVMSEEEQQRLQREIISRRRDIQRTQEAFREDFNMRRNEELAQLQRLILETVGQFAKDEKFDLIVSDGVIYASDAVNVTDRIIERLHQRYESNHEK